jgi:hypothetical protein
VDVEHTKYLLDDLSKDLTLYSELYGPEDSVSILNNLNGFVFGRLQFCLSERIYLGFARFMDPAESRVRGGTSANLSLKNLIEKYSLKDDETISEIYNEIEVMYQNTNISEYRNKLLGHNDKDVKLGFTQVDIEITPNLAHKLLSLMMKLVNDISNRTGRIITSKSSDSNNIIAYKNSSEFLTKLKKIVFTP